jgi:hypothetical protein
MIEDRLATALRDTGEEITPDSVPPLRLRGAQRRVTLPRLPRRWMTGLAPLAAAAAVVVVVVASLPISAMFQGHIHRTGPAAAPPWNGSPIGPRSALRQVPPYFVTLPPQGRIYDRTEAQPYARTATVRSTVTGRVLATVRVPRPYKVFTWVSGTADDRTFVLAAQRWWDIGHGQAGMPAQNRDGRTPTVFYRLTFHPATGAAPLTRLTVPEKVHSSDIGGVGVSPDGTRLALTLRKTLQIITLSTGDIRTWTWPGHGWIGNWKPFGQIFSWSADGRYLAFQVWGGRYNETAHVRILDTAAPGTSVTAARNILTFAQRPGILTFSAFNTLLTADGTKIVTTTTFSPRQRSRIGYVEITEFSVRTGKPVLSQDRFSASLGYQEVLWASPDGRALVISDPRGRKDSYGGRANVLGVLAGNKFTPIPHGADNATEIAW